MADNKNKTTAAIGIISAAAALLTAAKPLADAVINKMKTKDEDTEELVKIPELCDQKFVTTLERADGKLTDAGLKMDSIPMQICEANIKYKDCIEFQIIRTNPKCGTKQKIGTHVDVVYMTKEVIEKSNQLFEEQEANQKQLSLEKTEKSIERKEKAKLIMNNVKGGIKKVIPNLHKHGDEEKSNL